MHTHDLAEWRHDHAFDGCNLAGERSTLRVMWITAAMMVVEIVAGWFYSCALSLVTHEGQLTPKQVRAWLSIHEEIVHSTIEIQRCTA